MSNKLTFNDQTYALKKKCVQMHQWASGKYCFLVYEFDLLYLLNIPVQNACIVILNNILKEKKNSCYFSDVGYFLRIPVRSSINT